MAAGREGEAGREKREAKAEDDMLEAEKEEVLETLSREQLARQEVGCCSGHIIGHITLFSRCRAAYVHVCTACVLAGAKVNGMMCVR